MKKCSCESMEKRGLKGVSSVSSSSASSSFAHSSIRQFAHSHISIFSHYILPLSLHFTFLFTFTFSLSSFAYPIREWDWHMPGEIYKTLEFTDRAGVDRAVKLFEKAANAEWNRARPPDLVPLYRNAANEFRKIQVKGEAEDFDASLLSYAVFMQGYAYMQANDRNKAMNLFNEVLDLYPEQKYIAVPARYLISRLKRAVGDVRQADEDILEIIEDKGADGHPVYALVFRDFASIHWNRGELEDAMDCWRRLVFEVKGVPGDIWRDARWSLLTATAAFNDFSDYEKIVVAGSGDSKKRKADLIAENADWMAQFGRDGNHGVAQSVRKRFPKDGDNAKREKEMKSIRKNYLAWFDGEHRWFDGEDDGWRMALLKLHLNAGFEDKDAFAKRLLALQKLVQGAKPDQVNGRANTLVWELVKYGQNDSARAATEFCNNHLAKLSLKYHLEVRLGDNKAATLYIEEIVGMKPPPEDLRGWQYELAGHYLNRAGLPEKAVKLYEVINDPPRSLWGLASALRASKKPDAAYATMQELTFFPKEAPEAVLTMARWREADGQKDKAIGLYRSLMKHPEWKKTGQSSAAHQALERLGIATGGAMTNEVR